MHIVLPGALPGPDAAKALLPHLEENAPTFASWLSGGRARMQAVEPDTAGCTAYEQWQLEQAGFTPEPQQNLNAGLGPLWAEGHNIQAQQPVWLAELIHMAPTQSSTALITAADLNITQQQSVALFESAQTLFNGTGFHLHQDSDTRWRIDPPPGFTFRSTSPSMVATASVNDWWPQDEAVRPWRRLFNEIQMLWFDHSVNLARQAQGEHPINGLWLFGGGRMEQLSTASASTEVRHYRALLAPFMAQDWGGWLAALAELEAEVFVPLARQGTQPRLVLTGRNEIVTLEPRAMARLPKWLGGGRRTWSKWWLYRN